MGEIILDSSGSRTPVLIDGEPLTISRRLTQADLRRGVVLELASQVTLLLHQHPPVTPELPRFGLIGDSSPMFRLRREIKHAASMDVPVLLRGASGTGKELVARALHEASDRRRRPWIAVNMAAIPPALAAAELFGSRKGAFTGADGHKEGFFRAADGGTLFLDEIADTPPEVQPLLLRALENGEIQSIGETKNHKVDVRIIAATDADLDARIKAGLFRAPLLHRLDGFPIHLPRLAERRSDVGRLLIHFLERELEGSGFSLEAKPGEHAAAWPPASLVARLVRYHWPGNVRQLANVARRLAIARRSEVDEEVVFDSLMESLLTDARSHTAAQDLAMKSNAENDSATDHSGSRQRTNQPHEPLHATPGSPTGKWRPVYRKASSVSEDELLEALRAHQFILKPTAEDLGVSRAVLYRLIEACPRVRKASELDSEEIQQALKESGDDLTAVAQALEVSLQGLKHRMTKLGMS